MEFPHLLRLMEGNQFDTIYQEHFSYFSFNTARRVFAAHGLEVFDVVELPTHGGSLRVFASRRGETPAVESAVETLLEREQEFGLEGFPVYDSFAERVREAKRKLLEFLIQQKRAGKQIAAYGAPAKGNTLLNYCGIRADFIEYTVDRNPLKQGKLLPGTHIPVLSPVHLRETKPDYVFIPAVEPSRRDRASSFPSSRSGAGAFWFQSRKWRR